MFRYTVVLQQRKDRTTQNHTELWKHMLRLGVGLNSSFISKKYTCLYNWDQVVYSIRNGLNEPWQKMYWDHNMYYKACHRYQIGSSDVWKVLSTSDFSSALSQPWDARFPNYFSIEAWQIEITSERCCDDKRPWGEPGQDHQTLQIYPYSYDNALIVEGRCKV